MNRGGIYLWPERPETFPEGITKEPSVTGAVVVATAK